jgi:hypothetical protein
MRQPKNSGLIKILLQGAVIGVALISGGCGGAKIPALGEVPSKHHRDFTGPAILSSFILPGYGTGYSLVASGDFYCDVVKENGLEKGVRIRFKHWTGKDCGTLLLPAGEGAKSLGIAFDGMGENAKMVYQVTAQNGNCVERRDYEIIWKASVLDKSHAKLIGVYRKEDSGKWQGLPYTEQIIPVILPAQ